MLSLKLSRVFKRIQWVIGRMPSKSQLEFELLCTCSDPNMLDDAAARVVGWLEPKASSACLYGSTDRFVGAFVTVRNMRIDNASASFKRLLPAAVNVEVKCGQFADSEARFEEDDEYVRLFSMSDNVGRSSGGRDSEGETCGNGVGSSNQELLDRLSRMEEKLMRVVPTHVTNFNFIIINDFGKEDTSYMPDVDRWLKLRSKGVVLAIKEIHFNDNHMENRNVRLKSSKKATVEVVENGAWTVRCLLSVQDTMIRNAFMTIAARYVKDDAYRDEVQEADGQGLVDWVMQMMCAGHENHKVMVPIRRDLQAMLIADKPVHSVKAIL